MMGVRFTGSSTAGVGHARRGGRAVTPDSVKKQFAAWPAVLWQSCPVKLLAIRGYQELVSRPGIPDPNEPKNELGVFDDAIVRIIGDRADTFAASTDPGRKYMDDPLNADGCAQLQLGLWYFQPGVHRGEHLALVQASEFRIWRLRPDGTRHCESSGWFGINNHSGGDLYDVGGWSAGCQVVRCPEGGWGKTWLDYLDPILDALAASVASTSPACAEALRERKMMDYGAVWPKLDLRVPYLLVDRLVPLEGPRWSVNDPGVIS